MAPVEPIIVRGEWYSSYHIVIPRNYFEAITVSYKFLLNGIITTSILIAAYRRMSMYIEQYELSKDGGMLRCIYACGQTLFLEGALYRFQYKYL